MNPTKVKSPKNDWKYGIINPGLNPALAKEYIMEERGEIEGILLRLFSLANIFERALVTAQCPEPVDGTLHG